MRGRTHIPRATVVGFGRRFAMRAFVWQGGAIRLRHQLGVVYVPDLSTGVCTSDDADGFQVRLCPSALRRLRRMARETGRDGATDEKR